MPAAPLRSRHDRDRGPRPRCMRWRGAWGDDLVIAIERPPPGRDRQLAAGVAGEGFEGTLSSDSTRMRGYALATDIAPTILERLGLSVPDEMSGEPIEASRGAGPGLRRAARGPPGGGRPSAWPRDRHQPADLGRAGAARRGRLASPWPSRGAAPARGHGRLSAGGVAADGCASAERARRTADCRGRLAGAGARSPCAWLPRMARWRSPGPSSVLGYAVDVVAGSPLTALSLVGPNPAAGVRFFGIGNELEAIVVALVPIATGAALAAWAPRISPRGAALAFARHGAGRRRRVRAGAVRRRRRRRDRDPGRSGGGGGRLPLRARVAGCSG